MKGSSWMTRLIGRALLLAIAALGFASTARAAPCTLGCLTPGDYNFVTISGGLPRTYLVHVPASYSGGEAVPLVLDLHGFSSSADEERRVSGQLQQSDKRGFIAVWPQGLALSWNGYGCCFVADVAKADDVGFLRSLIGLAKAHANIDSDRVFVTGISNGGSMAMRMACESADIVRAVVSVSFPLNTDQCHPSRPISVTEIAGTADTTISYYGGPPLLPGLPGDIAGIPFGKQSAADSLAAWKAIDNCSANIVRTPLPGDSYADVYPVCTGGTNVGLVTIPGGKHVLYNGYTGVGYDGNNAPFDLSEYIWNNVFNL
ncbi:MAG TPA: PHB depolymerase family esterase [Sphingomonas sp.]